MMTYGDVLNSLSESPWAVPVLTSLLVLLWMYKTAPTRGAENVSVGLKQLAEEAKSAPEADRAAPAGPRSKVLNALKWTPLELQSTTKISPDATLFRLRLPREDDELGIPVGRHISVRADVDGETVVRPYTPVSLPTERGYTDLLVKRYEMGKMSRYFHDLVPGDQIDVRGPVGNLRYTPNQYCHIVLVAAGSGITPVLQIARAVLSNPEDTTTLSLVYQNRTVDDILLRSTLDALRAAHPDQFAVQYFLSRPPKRGYGSRPEEKAGYCDCELVANILASSKRTGQTKVMMCGPSTFNKSVKDGLESLGITDVHVF